LKGGAPLASLGMARGGQDTPPELARAGITPRELEVLRCVVQRLSNREIAERLVVSSRTVESHVSALLAKLGVTTRRELGARGNSTKSRRGCRPDAW